MFHSKEILLVGKYHNRSNITEMQQALPYTVFQPQAVELCARVR